MMAIAICMMVRKTLHFSSLFIKASPPSSFRSRRIERQRLSTSDSLDSRGSPPMLMAMPSYEYPMHFHM